MTPNDFLTQIQAQGWVVNHNPVNTECFKISKLATSRLKRAPQFFVDFIASFSTCANADDTAWFLSYVDYTDDEDVNFPWNKFENQSIDSANDDVEQISSIKSFWESHIPFFMSIEEPYSYFAICIEDGDNYGKIYQGNESNFETVSFIANNMGEFFAIFFNLQF